MGKEVLTLGDIETEKHKFWIYKSPNFLEDIDIDNVLVSNKICPGEKNYKHFIGYLHDNYKIEPLHIMLSKMRAYIKIYDGQINGCIFWLKMMNYWKNIILVWKSQHSC